MHAKHHKKAGEIEAKGLIAGAIEGILNTSRVAYSNIDFGIVRELYTHANSLPELAAAS